MTDTFLPIILEERGAIAVITFNRPAQFNCLTTATMAELTATLARLRERDDLCVLIVTGASGVFSAGADLNEVASLDATTAYDFSRRGQALLASLGEATPVTIAAIDGYCLGGGLDIALACDLRYATPRSTFQHPGAKRGIITGWGGTQRLPRLIGVDETRRLLITGDRIDAREAFRIGLVNRICDDALSFTQNFAADIVQRFSREQLLALKSSLAT
ncbi:MAG: enoyl-CoA hydratase/isomerase family protein [Acidobacteriota bacterium]